MTIVGGFDVHRGQITFDYLRVETGEVVRGRIAPADRPHLATWLSRLGDEPAAFALEGCTGWRYVVEELAAAGMEAHVAEPAETSAQRGPKRRAKTDREDSRHLRELLQGGRLAESWIPPTHVLEARARVRLYKDLLDERTAWAQRIQATLFHQGVPVVGSLREAKAREQLASLPLSPAGAQAVAVARHEIDAINAELDPLRAEIARFSRRQLGCRGLQAHYGIGPFFSVAIWAEMGDARRFSSSADAVRHTGLDVSVWSSDRKRAKGHLARQGPSVLRWSLYEAAQCAAKKASPDHAYYLQVRERLGHQRAALSVARKLARWCHHTLRAMGDAAWEAVDEEGTGRNQPNDVMTCGQLREPECCHEPALDSPQRMSGRNLRGDDPINHHVTGARSEHRDKSGRPHTGSSSSRRPEREEAAMS